MTIWALLAALLFPGGVAVDPVRPAPVYSAPVQPIPLPLADQPEEDEPGWNCATMGNRICGPDVLDSWTWGPSGS